MEYRLIFRCRRCGRITDGTTEPLLASSRDGGNLDMIFHYCNENHTIIGRLEWIGEDGIIFNDPTVDAAVKIIEGKSDAED